MVNYIVSLETIVKRKHSNFNNGLLVQTILCSSWSHRAEGVKGARVSFTVLILSGLPPPRVERVLFAGPRGTSTPISLYRHPAVSNDGFIEGILRGVRCTKSLRVLFLHRRSLSWTTLVLYSRAVFIFNEPALSLLILSPQYALLFTQNRI